MANLQQIANCLMKTIEGNTATIKQAELYLERASKQDSFITILLNIPQMDGVSSQLARIATIYTLTYARNIVLWRSQALINKTAQLFLQFLANPAINFNYKDQISAALQYLIEKDQNNIIVSAFISNMIDTLKKNNQTPVTQINFEFIVAVSEALSDKIVPAVGGRVQEYIRESIAGLSYLGVKIVELGAQYKGTDNSFLERALILITKILKTLKKYLRKLMFFQPSTSVILQHQNFLQLIKSVLTLNLPQNPQNIPLFYLPSKTSTLSSKLVQYFHTIKSLIIFIITQSLRVIMSNYKIFNVGSFQQIKIAVMGHQFIGAFVQAVEKMLLKMPYFKIKSRAVFKIVGEVYDFLTAALRTGKYYNILNQTKQTVIYSCILKTLAFTPQDYSNYYHNPQQFTYSLFHILDIDANLLLNKDTPLTSTQDENISIIIFDTLKTHGANLLKAYCKYIDGTVADIFNFAINVIDDKLNIQISKNLMYVVLGVLRDQASNRDDLLEGVERIVFRDLTDLQIPTKRVEEPYSNSFQSLDIQYTLNLLVLHRYLLIFDKRHQKLKNTHLKYSLIERSFILTQSLLKQPKLEQTPKLIASQLLYSILSTEQSQMYSRRTIEILNGIISAQHINGKYLQCVQQIIKFNAQPFVHDYVVLVDLVQRVAGLLIGELKKKDKGEGNEEVVDKLWHILEAFAQSQELGVPMADTIRRVLQPLINMIDGNNQLQLEQKVYKILVTIIQKTAQASQYQLQILSILPKTFYTGKKKRSLTTSFPLLHLLLMYGKQHLKQPTILKNLILLCIENINSKTVNQIPRPETQCLEGVLILQSLIISVGGVLTAQMWVVIAKSIVQKIKDVFVYLFVKAQVLALLMVVLVGGSACFGAADCQEILKLIMANYDCLNYYHPCKLFILSCCSLLQQPSLPFLHPHLPHIFDLTITLLKLSTKLSTQSQSLRKDSEQIELDGQQKQYNILICFSITPYSKVDEYEWFKGTINVLKQQNEAILNALYQQLPEVKKKYLSELLNVRRVGDNARVIFKVRNNNKSEM